MARPVEILHQAMRRHAEGHLDVKTPVITNDEIGGLAAGFNEMLDQVRERDFIKETFGRYMPRSVADTILSNKGEFVPETKLATILFIDIDGFTALCERLSPAEVVALLDEYFNLVIGVIHKHGGIVNQFQGHAILVAFNVPIEKEDHARAAIRTVLEIQDQLAAHIFQGGEKMRTRIGINTGSVIAGSVGANERLNYTVHGDTVNIAARLEQMNKEFGSRGLISEDTKNLAGDTDGFEFTAMGAMPIHGKTQEVTVYGVGNSN